MEVVLGAEEQPGTHNNNNNNNPNTVAASGPSQRSEAVALDRLTRGHMLAAAKNLGKVRGIGSALNNTG